MALCRIPTAELRSWAERIVDECRNNTVKRRQIEAVVVWLEMVYKAGFEDGAEEEKMVGRGL